MVGYLHYYSAVSRLHVLFMIRMRAIPDDHMSLPAQAARCRIADLLPADGKSWNPGDASLMAQLLTRKSLLATIRVRFKMYHILKSASHVGLKNYLHCFF